MSRNEKSAPLRMAKAGFSDLVVVCAKCAKRQGLRKGEAARAVKRALKRTGSERKTKVIASGCLGPCPKRFVAVATPASLAAKRVMLLDPACSREGVAALLPDFGLKG